jgi:hypothetical protein
MTAAANLFYIFDHSNEPAEDTYNIDDGDDRGDRSFPGVLVEEELSRRKQIAQPAYECAVQGDNVQAAGIQAPPGYLFPFQSTGTYERTDHGECHPGQGVYGFAAGKRTWQIPDRHCA